MKKKFQTGTKALSILLILLFLLQTLPMQVFAQSLSTTPPAADITTRDAELELDEEALLYMKSLKNVTHTPKYTEEAMAHTPPMFPLRRCIKSEREIGWILITRFACKRRTENLSSPMQTILCT